MRDSDILVYCDTTTFKNDPAYSWDEPIRVTFRTFLEPGHDRPMMEVSVPTCDNNGWKGCTVLPLYHVDDLPQAKKLWQKLTKKLESGKLSVTVNLDASCQHILSAKVDAHWLASLVSQYGDSVEIGNENGVF